MGLIDKKVGSFSLGEALAVGVTKSLSEQVLTPVIGNGNLVSGSVKLIGAWGLPKVWNNKATRVLATAWAVDGVEDVVRSFFKGGVANASQGSNLI